MPQNKKKVIEARRAQVSELYLEGNSQQRIAKMLSVSQGQVSRDLKIISERWQADSRESIDKIKAKDLAKLAHLERTFHDGWFRSVQEQFTERSKATTVDGKATKESYFERKTLVGDAAFLNGVLRCLERRAQIMGYDAPKKMDHTTQGDKITENKVIILPPNGRESVDRLKGGAKEGQIEE